MNRHPLSAVFGDMPKAELQQLADDIKSHGLREPVVVYQDQVLDGWHRYRACDMAGVLPTLKHLPATDDPIAFVSSKNLHRRSLTASQKAAIVVQLHEWHENGTNQHAPIGGRAPGALPQATTKQMAEEAGVSERTIKQAKVAVENGHAEAVIAGEISVKEAAKKPDAPEKPKAPSPLDKAQDTISELQETVSTILAELDAARHELDALRLATAEEEERAAYIRSLQEEMSSLRTTNDDHKHTIRAHIRQIKALQKRLKDAGLE